MNRAHLKHRPQPQCRDRRSLSGVAAVSASDVWAVGQNGNAGTLTEQWNGTSWNVVKSPNAGTSFNNLNAVAVVSTNDIWAVGNTFNTSLENFETLIEQWNGTNWSIVNSPNVGTGTGGNNLLGVAAITATDAWATGYWVNSSNGSGGLIEQYCC